MQLNNITGIINKINNINDPNVMLSKGLCMIYGFDDKCITNIADFNNTTKKKKKLKLKFMDGMVSFDIRNIIIDEQ